MDADARRAQATVPARRISYLGTICLLAAIYFGAAKLALVLAIPPGYATAVWPPSGIAFAAILLLGNRMWPGIWLGAGLVNVTIQSSLVAATVMATGNTLEALAGAALVRQYGSQPGAFERGQDVVEFIAIAALSAAVAATVAAVPLAFVHSLARTDLLWNWWTWWQGDAAGILIVTPLILSWAARDGAAWPRWRVAEAAGLALLSLGITYAIFSDSAAAYVPSVPLTFAILPFVIWAAVRFRQRDVATLNATVCAVAIWFTLKGSGPFAQASLDSSLLLLLAFMSTVVATGLVLNAALRERRHAIDGLRNALHDLREQTLRDPLTSLYNRRFLRDYLPRELIRAERDRARLAVIMIDLDHFKQINDSAGHAAGDEVLVEIAALLTRHIRGSDIACRYGGEEFTLVLPNATLESAHRRCDAIRSAVRKDRQKLLDVTASFGVAMFPAHAAETDTLLRAADRALYEAKKAGRDQVRIHQGPTENPRTRRQPSRAPDKADG